MPTSISADPVEAGFAPQWAERSLDPHFASLRGVLAVMANKKRSGDSWPYALEDHLRQVIKMAFEKDSPTVSRVFCNSVGCLVYMERTNSQTRVAPGWFATWQQVVKSPDWAKTSGVDQTRIDITSTSGFPVSADQYTDWILVYLPRAAAPGASHQITDGNSQ
jgi:hypothetical protein